MPRWRPLGAAGSDLSYLCYPRRMRAGRERAHEFSAHRSASQLSVSQTDPFIGSRVRLTLTKREERPPPPFFLTLLLQLTNLGLLGGIWNTDALYGVWELLKEPFCDRGRGLETSTIKMEVTRSLFSSVFWDEVFSSEEKKV